MASTKSTSRKGSTQKKARKAAPSTNGMTSKARSAPAKASAPVPKPSRDRTLTADERHRMIAEAAYFRALQRGFQGGNPEQDWLEAAASIDAQYVR